MKVLLLEIKPGSTKKCINKDLAGGMGTGTWVGNSLGAKVFEYVKKANVILPVIAVPYLAAIFKRAGWEVKVLNVEKKLGKLTESFDLALVPTSIVDCNHELTIVEELKQQGVNTGVYGTFASAVPEFFSGKADFVINGEAEAGALNIVSRDSLPIGIVNVGFVEDINSLPFPDWEQFPVKKYSYSPALNKKPILPMLSSRGCPYSCFFYCPYPLGSGKVWRSRSVGNIIEEIKYLKEKHKIKAIDFRDPIFTLDKERAVKFANELINEKIDIIWSCETRLDCLNKEMIKIMHKAGLRNLNVGIESSDPDILRGSQRLPVEYRQQEEMINYCHSLGINVAAFYILGLDNDTEESIERTIKYAKKLNTLVAQFSLSTPYPGTGFFDKLKKENKITDYNWENYDEYTPVFRHKNLTPEKLLSLKEKAFVSYYFRPWYLLRHMPKYFFQKFLWPF